jgi:hypothetical protein
MRPTFPEFSKELALLYIYWFKSVYEKNTLGCLPVWDKLLECISKTDEDGLDLGFTEFYTVALPLSLTPNSDLVPVKFKFSSSHTTIRGIDCEASLELLCTLLDLLHCKKTHFKK